MTQLEALHEELNGLRQAHEVSARKAALQAQERLREALLYEQQIKVGGRGCHAHGKMTVVVLAVGIHWATHLKTRASAVSDHASGTDRPQVQYF